MRYMVAVDDSPSSVHAFNKAVAMMNLDKDELFLLSVAESPMPMYPVAGTDMRPILEANERQLQHHRGILKHFGQYCKAHNVNVTLLLSQGDARKVVCDEVVTRKVDILVVGRRGMGAVKRLFLGSLSKYLMEHAECHVLVVHEENKVTGERPDAMSPRIKA